MPEASWPSAIGITRGRARVRGRALFVLPPGPLPRDVPFRLAIFFLHASQRVARCVRAPRSPCPPGVYAGSAPTSRHGSSAGARRCAAGSPTAARRRPAWPILSVEAIQQRRIVERAQDPDRFDDAVEIDIAKGDQFTGLAWNSCPALDHGLATRELGDLDHMTYSKNHPAISPGSG